MRKKWVIPVSNDVDIGEARMTSEWICQVVMGSVSLGFRGVSDLTLM